MDFLTFYQNFYRSYQEDNKGLRMGQFFMNELGEYDLELYRSVPMEVDCFYNDTLLLSCLEWVSKNWKDTSQTVSQDPTEGT